MTNDEITSIGIGECKKNMQICRWTIGHCVSVVPVLSTGHPSVRPFVRSFVGPVHLNIWGSYEYGFCDANLGSLTALGPSRPICGATYIRCSMYVCVTPCTYTPPSTIYPEGWRGSPTNNVWNGNGKMWDPRKMTWNRNRKGSRRFPHTEDGDLLTWNDWELTTKTLVAFVRSFAADLCSKPH